MDHSLSEVSSLSILLAAFFSAARFRAAHSSYLPFIFLLWIGAVNEVLSVLLMNNGHHTAINNNIYVLLEAILILHLYRELVVPEKKNKLFYLLLVSYVVFWVIDNFWISKITRISSYFRIYYSFTIVLLNVSLVNQYLFSEEGISFRSPSFLISFCFIVFFTYKILVEAFWIYGLNNSEAFRNSVYTLLLYLNLIMNLVFAVVVLWIPKKEKSLLLS